MTKKDCIEKICLIPLDFKTANKSPFDLSIESTFLTHRKDISTSDIKEYLLQHPDLIKSWDIWSADKRTDQGFYFFSDNSKSFVGYLNLNRQRTQEIIFDSPVDACADFILKEVSSILQQYL